MFEPGDDVVVEWRGVTVGFLDRLRVEVNKALKTELQGNELTLAQLLEAGSWKVCLPLAGFLDRNIRRNPGLSDRRRNMGELTRDNRVDAKSPKSAGPTPRSRRS
jgi:hypothetical protein